MARASDPEMASGAPLSRALPAARPLVVASLAAHLGDLDAAEEAFAEACVALTESGAEPDNLAGWLITVGKRKAIDRIRKRDARQRADDGAAQIAELEEPDMDNVITLPEPIADERLRLIFICCHPALAPEARAALALKVICGLPVNDIASLFLTSEPTMYQRITRAKAKIEAAKVSFELPPRAAWPERLGAVLLTLELAYTTAYQDAGGSNAINDGGDLAREIERLATMLAELLPKEPEVLGIAALVTLACSREAARVDESGAMVPLSKQDTALWDRDRIERARVWLDQAATHAQTGPYQVMAAIQLTHARRVFDGDVDWASILKLYDALMVLRPGPMVWLNRAMALAEVEGATLALRALEDKALSAARSSRPYLVAKARVLAMMGEPGPSSKHILQALQTQPPEAERLYLEKWEMELPKGP
ncbi:MAG: DUF6596 domain-containing protein [Pseudomonadota bacterium]